MIKVTLLLFCFLILNNLKAQNLIEITADPGIGTTSTAKLKDGDNFPVDPKLSQLLTFSMKYSTLPTNNKLIVDCSGNLLTIPAVNEYTDGTKSVAYIFQNDIMNKQITIKQKDNSGNISDLFHFKFIQVVKPSLPVIANTLQPLSDVIDAINEKYISTPMGFIDPNATAEKLDIVHIFLDQFGNNILGTIPQGISNKQYKIHIEYPINSKQPDDVDYSIKQKTGSFSSALLFNNTGILNTISSNLHGYEQKNYDNWKEKTFILSTTTDDITFDVVATTVGSDNKPVNGVLQTYTIKMSPVYHGTFDIGLINSDLSNPTFSLVQSPDNANNMVIKQTNKAPTGIVTLMATLYTSPVILFEKLFEKRSKKHIPNYKLSGRNFLDDHKFFERIYPTVGVSLSDKTFQNLFFGLNWEIARALSIFGGGHWGKVNNFEKPEYTSGTFPVTQTQFDYYSNTKWKVAWAYGVKLDILIITNLFK